MRSQRKREQEVTWVRSTYIKGMEKRKAKKKKVKNGQEGRKWDQRVNHEENLGVQVLL